MLTGWCERNNSGKNVDLKHITLSLRLTGLFSSAAVEKDVSSGGGGGGNSYCNKAESKVSLVTETKEGTESPQKVNPHSTKV